MKTRRAFQIVLAVLATLAALAFCATAIFVLVPLATGHKLPFLGEVVDGIYKIFATQYLSTTQVVIAESLFWHRWFWQPPPPFCCFRSTSYRACTSSLTSF